MPQLSLYVTDGTMDMLRSGSHDHGMSISRYANTLIKKGREAEDSESAGAWPPGYWESVYGCLSDDDSFELPDDPPIDFAELDRKLGLVD